jgi:hypothetical protein
MSPLLMSVLAVAALIALALLLSDTARRLGRPLVVLAVLPGTALAQGSVMTPSHFDGISNQLLGLALVIVIAPLLAVLAHRYLPAAEVRYDAAVDANPFFQKHARLSTFAKLFGHYLDLELITLSDNVVARAKAEGKFDAHLANEVKGDAIDSALRMAGQSNRDELAKALGFEIPGQVDEYLSKLLEGHLATLKAQGIVKQPGAQVVSVTIPAPVAAKPAVASVP